MSGADPDGILTLVKAKYNERPNDREFDAGIVSGAFAELKLRYGLTCSEAKDLLFHEFFPDHAKSLAGNAGQESVGGRMTTKELSLYKAIEGCSD